jgi:hypothetical protein
MHNLLIAILLFIFLCSPEPIGLIDLLDYFLVIVGIRNSSVFSLSLSLLLKDFWAQFAHTVSFYKT